MKQTLRIAPVILALLLASCSTILPGNDPVVVNAERAITTARATFDLVEKTEYDTYPALKAVNPSVAVEIRTFVNKVRASRQKWEQSATDLKNAYKKNRNADNKASLDTGLAVLTSATAQAVTYIALMAQTTNTHGWLSYQLAAHTGERK